MVLVVKNSNIAIWEHHCECFKGEGKNVGQSDRFLNKFIPSASHMNNNVSYQILTKLFLPPQKKKKKKNPNKAK